MSAQRAWYREPLLHFVVVGLALTSIRASLHAEGPPTIVLGPELDQALTDEYQARHGETPTPEALDAARARWVRDEALYREALALGLDEGDAIVRRRLIQKMEFVLGASVALEPITEEERQAYLEAHPDAFALPERRTLEDRFFRDPLAAMNPDAPSDPFLGGEGWSSVSEAELARAVTPAFARAVFALPEDTWSEPLVTPEGVHRVRVVGIAPRHLPPLASVASRIDAELGAERASAALEAAARELVSRYELVP